MLQLFCDLRMMEKLNFVFLFKAGSQLWMGAHRPVSFAMATSNITLVIQVISVIISVQLFSNLNN